MTGASCLNPLKFTCKNRVIQRLTRSIIIGAMTTISLIGHTYEPHFIFEETFDSGLAGYTTSGNVSAGDGSVILRGGSHSYITKEVDLTGFDNVYIEATSSTYGLDYGESYSISYSVDGTSFTELDSDREVTGTIVVGLPAWLKNQTVYLRFELSASSYFERFTIDYFRVRGDTYWLAPTPPVSSVEDRGPYTTTQIIAGPNNTTLITMPATLGENGFRHPIFVWGPATGQSPEADTALLEHLASHGFVVLSDYSTGNGSEMLASLAWLQSESITFGNPFHGEKLNTSQVGIGGHSRGARSALAANPDYRILTSIHVAGASNFFSADPEDLNKPALYIAAEEDAYTTQDMQNDFDDTQVSSVFTVIDGVDETTINSASFGMITAWLRWHITGEFERKDQFVGSNCEYCQTPYNTQSKLFN